LGHGAAKCALFTGNKKTKPGNALLILLPEQAKHTAAAMLPAVVACTLPFLCKGRAGLFAHLSNSVSASIGLCVR
jgi:hypothetical protein